MNKILIVALYGCFLAFGFNGFTQSEIPKPDLATQRTFQMANRDLTLLTNNQGKSHVHLNASSGAGIAWIMDSDFKTGTLEFDVKGEDKFQESFVGIAFHAQNDSTYEGIYFRPFNFQSDEIIRKNHSVQYISMPGYDWSYLRKTYPGTYEHALLAVVDPNDWFHVRVSVTRDIIQVFVNADTQPSLVIQPLTPPLLGKVGFWVGHNSAGDFADLVIKSN